MSISSVSWPERIVFGLLCVATAGAPLLAHVAIHSLPGAAEESWFDGGIYVSWAFLIYFSWACLPDLDLPDRKRRLAWAAFLALEVAYPLASWVIEGGSRLHAFADVASYFSTSLALAAGLLLAHRGVLQLREEPGLIIPLGFLGFFVVWPGISVEWSWWRQVELPMNDVPSQILRSLGVVAGTSGVYRNLRGSRLFA